MTLEEMEDRSQFGLVLNSMGLTGTGVELGVFKGEFSNQLLWHWKGSLIGVDSYNQGAEFHLLWDAIRNNKQYIQDSRYKIIINTTYQASAMVQDELDFVYVDADHSYHAVKSDIDRWMPKIKAGGILCGHDYNEEHGGVREAVDDFLSEMTSLRMIRKKCGSWFIQLP